MSNTTGSSNPFDDNFVTPHHPSANNATGSTDSRRNASFHSSSKRTNKVKRRANLNFQIDPHVPVAYINPSNTSTVNNANNIQSSSNLSCNFSSNLPEHSQGYGSIEYAANSSMNDISLSSRATTNDDTSSLLVAVDTSLLKSRRNIRDSGSKYIDHDDVNRNSANKVLRQLEHTNNHNGHTPWSKIILLEQLGTASSWVVLLLPYIALIIAMWMDQSLVPGNEQFTKSLSWGSMNGTVEALNSKECYKNTSQACYFTAQNSTCSNTDSCGGFALLSPALTNVHPLISSIQGDVSFQSLSSEIVEFVRQGYVYVSINLLQYETDEASESSWVPFASEARFTTPAYLPMVCIEETKDTQGSPTFWSCESPNLVEVLFGIPGTELYYGNDLRIEVKLTHNLRGNENDHNNPSLKLQSMIAKVATSSDELILQLVKSMSFSVSYLDTGYSRLLIAVRMMLLGTTFIFLTYWSWKMGIHGFFGSMKYLEKLLGVETITQNKKSFEVKLWWESPWVLMPERRYLFLLMICLLLLQNPFFAFMYFKPTFYSDYRTRVLSDAFAGIGAQFLLFLWLCLMHGLRYHTASVARRRANAERKILEMHKVIEERLRTCNDSFNNMNLRSREQIVAAFYNEFGDIDGVTSVKASSLRLKSDPCGSDWTDFLLPRIGLLLIGVISVILSAFCRFPRSVSKTLLTQEEMTSYDIIYSLSLMTQLGAMLIWILLIIWNTTISATRLRKEPFLSTRHAQLSFRVLASIQALGVFVVMLPFLLHLNNMFIKWKLIGSNIQDSSSSNMDDINVISTASQKTMLGVTIDADSFYGRLYLMVLDLTKKLPFANTAAAMMPGLLIYVTVSCLCGAFIFLPPDSDDTMDEVFLSTQEGQQIDRFIRRDKRHVVTLGRKTYTWRIFPLAIERLDNKESYNASFENLDIENALSLRSNTLQRSDQARYGNFAKLASPNDPRGIYTPVFCVEIACWLLECSWQAYYTHKSIGVDEDEASSGKQDLESLGLEFEAAINDEETDTWVYVCSNSHDQVDGEKDSIIVVSFRGTASVTNMMNDLKFRLLAIPDAISGMEGKTSPSIIATTNHLEIHEDTLNAHLNDSSSTFARKVLKQTPAVKQTLPCVHEGFLTAYSNVRSQILKSVTSVYHRQLAKSVRRWENRSSHLKQGRSVKPFFSLPKIYLTGHSLGGALAQLLALDLSCNFAVVVDEATVQDDPTMFTVTKDQANSDFVQRILSPHFTPGQSFFADESSVIGDCIQSKCFVPPIAVYTYGQTRVGNRAFARLYKSRVPHTFRVCNEGDALTSQPLGHFVGGFYKHAGLEVALDEGKTGNILVGPTVVETMFRFSKVRTSLEAHTMKRYRDCLERAFSSDELEEYYQGHIENSIRRNISQSNLKGSSSMMKKVPSWVTQIGK